MSWWTTVSSGGGMRAKRQANCDREEALPRMDPMVGPLSLMGPQLLWEVDCINDNGDSPLPRKPSSGSLVAVVGGCMDSPSLASPSMYGFGGGSKGRRAFAVTGIPLPHGFGSGGLLPCRSNVGSSGLWYGGRLELVFLQWRWWWRRAMVSM